MRKILFFLTIALFSLPYVASSQEAGGKNLLDDWSINVNGGISLFWGDLRQYKIYPVTNYESEWNTAFGFMISKKLSSVFELRGQFIKGNLSGTRRLHTQAYFDAQFNEYNLNATLNLSRLIFGYEPCRRLNIYGILGLGFVDFRSLKKQLGSNDFIYSRGYSGSGTVKEKMQTESVIPFGFGAKYNLTSRFEVNFENIWTGVNSDDIDATRGGGKYDILSYTSLGLTYRFNFRHNPTIFADCGDYTSSRTRKGSLGQAGTYEDAAAKAEKDSLNAKMKNLENRLNEQDSKIKELENKSKAPAQPEINIEALKTSIYNSIMDTLKRYPATIAASSGYLQFSIFFDVNKYKIKEDQMPKVASIAERMKTDSGLKLKLIGNADQTGAPEYNKYLSKKRAEEVYNTLINKYGIDKSRLSYEAKGAEEPFSKKQISVNRRVDFVKE